MASVAPFVLAVPQATLDDLGARLRATRWPERETVADAGQGVPLDLVREVCAYWRDAYDWRRCEDVLNGLGQFTTEIDGLPIHVLHVRSPHADALPLLITHGWPGSVIEFLKVVGPLTDPTRHGGDATQAFHVVAPSLPGYGFSGKPAAPGWGIARIARAWAELMSRLGYRDYVAQGGDWGAMVTEALAVLAPLGCRAIHLNMLIAMPDDADLAALTPEEGAALADMQAFRASGSGYQALQSTRPQTLGYALTDSPVGQAAWILEKLAAWSDCGGDPRSVFTLDEMLDNIMLYWLTASGASSARLYWEHDAQVGLPKARVELPTGCTIFPKEMMRPSRRWAERRFADIIHWRAVDRGGHFAAFEQPAIFTDELRTTFATVR